MMQTVPRTLWSAYRSSWSRLRGIAPYSWAFKLLNALLLTPVLSFGLQRLLARYGKASVGNFEIAQFLLSWPGVVALLVGGTVLITTVYVELAGLQLLLADRSLDWSGGLRSAARQVHRLLDLGQRQLVVCIGLAIPFLAGVGLIYWLFWSGRDLNGLIVLRPPAFWTGAALAGLLLAGYAVVAGRWLLRRLFAVPILLFEPGTSVTGALARSVELTTGTLWGLTRTLGVWLVVNLVLTAAVLWGLDHGSEWILNRAGENLSVVLPVTAALLVMHGLLVGLLSVFGTVSLAAVILGLYQSLTGVTHDAVSHPAIRSRLVPTRWWLAVGGMTLLLMASVAGVREFVRTQRLDDRVEFTAHRAGATHAPENTVAAVKRAMEDGAEWAEIDVQRTADQQIIVLHDIDLARSGGGKRRVDQSTLAEIQALDVGTALGHPGFAGEKIPTFAEFLDACGTRIRLNVELKPHNRADEKPLTELVVAELKRRGLTGRTRVCSQSYDSIQLAKELAPDLEIGFIAAKAVGDLSRLKVDFLMVETSMATHQLVDQGAIRKIAVHAWTVNDPRWVAPLVDAGVENIITDDPAAMRARLEEIRHLGTAERVLLRVRDELKR